MEEKKSTPTQEIDLLYFLQPVKNFAKKIQRILFYFLDIYSRNWYISFAIIVVIGIAGYSLRYVIPPSYKVEGTFVSHAIPNTYCEMMLSDLNQIIPGKNNLPILAEQLKINETAAAQLLSVSAAPLNDTFDLEKEDTITTIMSLFRVTAIVKDIKYIDTIQQGLLNYLENSEYAKKRKAIKIRSLESMKVIIQKRLESLDSVKKIVNNSIVSRSNGQGVILGEPINPVSIYNTEAMYYNQMQNINEKLANIDNIEVIQSFTKRSTFNYPDYDKLFIKSLITAVIAAFLFTPILAFIPGYLRRKFTPNKNRE